MSRIWRGIGSRIAAAAFAVGLVSVAILAAGVWLVGGSTFAGLMASHGEDATVARAMFDEAVARILAMAIGVAVIAAFGLATFVGGRLARPLSEIARGARRIAQGDYQARIARRGPQEVVGLADSFNQMAAALEEQERMRREFIANAAHELRTPLTNLQGYLEALRDGVIAPDRDTFESLWEEADRLVRLSRSLDELAVGDALESPMRVTELDLSSFLRSATDLARPAAAARDLAITLDVAPRLSVRADPDRLAQVVANLLQNATRYAAAGGEISVGATRQAGDVLVWVSNSGPAIPREDLPRLFDRFYRVEKSRDRHRGGAGIGLAIVRQVVEAAGGRVGVESAGDLTRFWFTVPATQ